MPYSQTTAIGVPPFGSSWNRVGNSCSGTRIEPGMWASANSESVRTSRMHIDSPRARRSYNSSPPIVLKRVVSRNPILPTVNGRSSL